MVHITWGIILACGKSEQLNGGADIGFLSLGDSPVLAYALTAYEQCSEIDHIIVVAPREKLDQAANLVRLFGCAKVKCVVPGTMNRIGCIQNGLKHLDKNVSVVSIHDVSRPCVSIQVIEDSVKAAKRYGSGVAAVRVEDTIKEVTKGQTTSKTLDSSKLWSIQTPQSFKRELIEKGLEAAAANKQTLSDESEALQLINKEVHLVPSDPTNVKIRSADDMVVVGALLRVK
jgi:2-C-methyl-D-erythritol 4-phosphate cytidylyltransferase